VGRRYLQYFHFTYRRSGSLGQVRYRAMVVYSERYLLTQMRYSELNPVRPGLVQHPGDYPSTPNVKGHRRRTRPVHRLGGRRLPAT